MSSFSLLNDHLFTLASFFMPRNKESGIFMVENLNRKTGRRCASSLLGGIFNPIYRWYLRIFLLTCPGEVKKLVQTSLSMWKCNVNEISKEIQYFSPYMKGSGMELKQIGHKIWMHKLFGSLMFSNDHFKTFCQCLSIISPLKILSFCNELKFLTFSLRTLSYMLKTIGFWSCKKKTTEANKRRAANDSWF